MFFRTLLVLFRALRARRRDVLAESVLRFRVMPDDLDVNVHMNNGRYLALMDLGRFDVIVRAGLYRPRSHTRRWPLIGSAMIRFRRSLRPFSSVRAAHPGAGLGRPLVRVRAAVRAGRPGGLLGAGARRCSAPPRAA